ncbi:MAG TPA: hypothetical protein ENG63_10960 [Candidatus Desulfofervidus auxilii]|uniref:Uncharacterized protein n=1 Tax=Desulfofervidus auxilii TaxID=1621989 RepID=A0A7C0U452_DESA2|nr:hypothetical protein [Candidatus Desulfofervidus auxilii]
MKKLFFIFFILFYCSLVFAEKYLIAPEDVIEVNVWKEPDISRVVLVRPDGKISLPLIGDIQAQGKTPANLAKDLEKAFSQYLENPVVTVIIQQINGAKFYVLGRVNQPGAYPLRSEITLLQAIAIAGGFAEWAKKSGVIILRKTGKGDERIVVNIEKIIKGKGAMDIKLQPGDRIIVP